MRKEMMLHYLRNPYCGDELEIRRARLQAADELERLYKAEERIINFLESLEIPKNLEEKI